MGALWSGEADVFRGCCCDVKLVIVASKNMEHILVRDFGATGRGMHEKITTAQGLEPDTVRRLRKIATIRNKLIHEVGYDSVDDQDNFKKDFHECVELLKAAAAKRGKQDPFASCIIS